MEFMSTDLQWLIKSPQQLQFQHITYFVYQILRALKYLHSTGLCHRDLKPANLLVNEQCDLKLCDFGMCKVLTEEEAHTEYVTTRWYRAPEILLGVKTYFSSMDIWSVGCIAAELVLRKPIFEAHNQREQVDQILGVLGSPDEILLPYFSPSVTCVDSLELTREQSKAFLRRRSGSVRQPWDPLFPAGVAQLTDEQRAQFFELLNHTLNVNWFRRFHAMACLALPFFAEIASVDDEPAADFKFDPIELKTYQDGALDEALSSELVELLEEQTIELVEPEGQIDTDTETS